MIVTCAVLATTLKSLTAAVSISVSAPCPTMLGIAKAPTGSTLDFSAAPLVRLDVSNFTNVILKGIVSNGSAGAGLNVVASKGVVIASPHIDHPGVVGITIQRSDSVNVESPMITHSLGDGIDIVGSTNVNIHDGACKNNILTANHPDCIQMWSLPGYQVQHITIQRMQVVGPTQGFDNFGDVAPTTDTNIVDNYLQIPYSNCIVFSNITKLTITGNRCMTLPGGGQGLALVKVFNSPGAIVSGNTSSYTNGNTN